jgi:hypothetical protein
MKNEIKNKLNALSRYCTCLPGVVEASVSSSERLIIAKLT